MAQVNGIDVDELREYVASVERDAAVAAIPSSSPAGRAAIEPRWRSRAA